MQNPGSLRKRNPRVINKVNKGLNIPLPGESPNEHEETVIPKGCPHIFGRSILLRFYILYNIVKYCFLLPYNLKRENNGLILFKKLSKPLILIWQLGTFAVGVISLFLLLYHSKAFFEELVEARVSGSYQKAILHFDLVMWHIQPLALNIIYTTKHDSIICFVNMMFATNQGLCEKYGVTSKEPMLNKPYWTSLYFLFIAQIPLSVTRYISLYKAPIFLTSSIVNLLGHEWEAIVVIVAALQELFIVCQLVSGMVFWFWLHMMYTSSMSFWLQEAHFQTQSTKTRQILRTREDAFKLYRTVQGLSAAFNDLWGIITPASILMLWSASISCGYVTVRSVSSTLLKEFPASILKPIGLLVTIRGAFSIISRAGILGEMSTSFLESWGATEGDCSTTVIKEKDVTLRAFLTSCRTVGVKASSFSQLSRGALLKYIQTVVGHVIDCIITFP